jgi:hypothetical protein
MLMLLLPVGLLCAWVADKLLGEPECVCPLCDPTPDTSPAPRP